jgi:hypothetical protein
MPENANQISDSNLNHHQTGPNFMFHSPLPQHQTPANFNSQNHPLITNIQNKQGPNWQEYMMVVNNLLKHKQMMSQNGQIIQNPNIENNQNLHNPLLLNQVAYTTAFTQIFRQITEKMSSNSNNINEQDVSSSSSSLCSLNYESISNHANPKRNSLMMMMDDISLHNEEIDEENGEDRCNSEEEEEVEIDIEEEFEREARVMEEEMNNHDDDNVEEEENYFENNSFLASNNNNTNKNPIDLKNRSSLGTNTNSNSISPPSSVSSSDSPANHHNHQLGKEMKKIKHSIDYILGFNSFANRNENDGGSTMILGHHNHHENKKRKLIQN